MKAERTELFRNFKRWISNRHDAEKKPQIGTGASEKFGNAFSCLNICPPRVARRLCSSRKLCFTKNHLMYLEYLERGLHHAIFLYFSCLHRLQKLQAGIRATKRISVI